MDQSKFAVKNKEIVSLASSASTWNNSSSTNIAMLATHDSKDTSLYSKRKCEMMYDALDSIRGKLIESNTQSFRQSNWDDYFKNKMNYQSIKDARFWTPNKSNIIKIRKKNVIVPGKAKISERKIRSSKETPRLNFRRTFNLTDTKLKEFL